jgi:Fanconi anemia group M protein
MAEDTRDEAYFWISRRKEKQMESELRELKGVADEVAADLDDGQTSLGEFDEDEPASEMQPGLQEFGGDGDGESAADESEAADGESETATEAEASDGVVATPDTEPEDDVAEIVIDQREMDSSIPRDLSTRDDVETRLETLEVGDYVLSDRVAVERKSVSDFLDTLTGSDRSLFEQLRDLSGHYARPVLIIEGTDSLVGTRDIHPNAVRGALASLAVDFGVSVLRTESEADTRDLLAVIAGREQTKNDREVSVHGEKAKKTLTEQQEYVVGAIADIGPVTARSLLAHFGTVEDALSATEEDLLAVDGVGSVTAERIREVVGSQYEPGR